jgi:general secretion pathway protein G
MKKKKKRSMTLLEVMIVIFIIGIIGSVIGYNMRGSMDQGKAFKTKEGITKLYNIVHLEMDSAEIAPLHGKESSEIQGEVQDALTRSGLVNRPGQYVIDGWKGPLNFTVVQVGSEYEIRATSTKYEEFCNKKQVPFDYPWQDASQSTNR